MRDGNDDGMMTSVTVNKKIFDPFHTPEQLLIFWYFQRVLKEISGIEWV